VKRVDSRVRGEKKNGNGQEVMCQERVHNTRGAGVILADALFFSSGGSLLKEALSQERTWSSLSLPSF